MEYAVKFNHSNRSRLFGGLLKSVIEDEFVERRSIAVDYCNPMYEEWNDEFHRLYPGKDGFSDEYNQFIKEKQQVGIDKANSVKFRGHANIVTLKVDDQCDFYGCCDKLMDIVTLELVEVNK